MDIILTKIVVAILFGIIRFVFGILPVKVSLWLSIELSDKKIVISKQKRTVVKHIIAKLQSFGAGVLFATCLLHMMPEVYYSVEELKVFGLLTAKYPFSQLIISLGFFLIYFVEEISHWFITRAPEQPCINKLQLENNSGTESISSENKLNPELNDLKQDLKLQNVINEMDDYYDKNIRNGITIIGLSSENKVDSELYNKTEEVRRSRSEMYDNVSENEETETQKEEMDVDLNDELNEELETIMRGEVKSQQQIVRFIFIVIALSFHAIFEGLAIGLQNSVTNIWYMFIAVSVHSATILFGIGLEIFLAQTKMKYLIIHILFLALSSPIGVVIGLVISLTADTHSKAKSITVVTLEGLSAGAIMYITFFESLIREKERRICRLSRAIYIGAGFALMAGLECAKMA